MCIRHFYDFLESQECSWLAFTNKEVAFSRKILLLFQWLSTVLHIVILVVVKCNKIHLLYFFLVLRTDVSE